jgi:hypothetical protein
VSFFSDIGAGANAIGTKVGGLLDTGNQLYGEFAALKRKIKGQKPRPAKVQVAPGEIPPAKSTSGSGGSGTITTLLLIGGALAAVVYFAKRRRK